MAKENSRAVASSATAFISLRMLSLFVFESKCKIMFSFFKMVTCMLTSLIELDDVILYEDGVPTIQWYCT